MSSSSQINLHMQPFSMEHLIEKMLVRTYFDYLQCSRSRTCLNSAKASPVTLDRA
jgi:hypothetical protein